MTTHTDTERLKAMEAAATKGPWECDTTHNEGSYGAGEDVYEGFKSYTILSEDGKVLFDSLNSDAIEVHEEYDEDGATAWDEIARRNAELIVAMRNALPSLLAQIKALTVEPEFPMSDAKLVEQLMAFGEMGPPEGGSSDGLIESFSGIAREAATRIEDLTRRVGELSEALQEIADDATVPAMLYAKNGPTWTGKDGHEYEDMSAHLEFAEAMHSCARRALDSEVPTK